jgi:hypothetical protein
MFRKEPPQSPARKDSPPLPEKKTFQPSPPDLSAIPEEIEEEESVTEAPFKTPPISIPGNHPSYKKFLQSPPSSDHEGRMREVENFRRKLKEAASPPSKNRLGRPRSEFATGEYTVPPSPGTSPENPSWDQSPKRSGAPDRERW